MGKGWTAAWSLDDGRPAKVPWTVDPWSRTYIHTFSEKLYEIGSYIPDRRCFSDQISLHASCMPARSGEHTNFIGPHSTRSCERSLQVLVRYNLSCFMACCCSSTATCYSSKRTVVTFPACFHRLFKLFPLSPVSCHASREVFHLCFCFTTPPSGRWACTLLAPLPRC